MVDETKKPSRATVVLKDTRTWSSGSVRFAVMTIEGHPENNYIKLEKDLVGRPATVGLQRFNLSLKDWNNLKKLIEVELPEQHGWLLRESGISLVPTRNAQELSRLVEQNPTLIEKILDLPNLRLLSKESFEYLNRLARKVHQVQVKHIELVFRNLSQASPSEFVQFASILKDLRLGQVATLVNLVKQKLEIIGLFERLATAGSTREKEIHKLIESNPWIADKSYEILASDQPLSEYLKTTVQEDPELRKRPDLIAKRVPNQEHIVLIELKAPGVQLKPVHIGQVLEYKALIDRFKPGTRQIDCYLFGYQKHPSFTIESKDVRIRTFAELISSLRDEYQTYLRVLEEDEQAEQPGDLPELSVDGSDIPF